MKIIKLRFLIILLAMSLTSCGGGRARNYDIAFKTCLYQANYNYQERGRSRTVNNYYKHAVKLCYDQRDACIKNVKHPMCKAFLRKYPK